METELSIFTQRRSKEVNSRMPWTAVATGVISTLCPSGNISLQVHELCT